MSHIIHLGDCIQGMRSLADLSIDVALLDPPYSEHVHASCRSGLTASNKSTRSSAEPSQISQRKALGFEHITQAQIEAVADQLGRLVRRWVLVFHDVESGHLWRGELQVAGLEYVRTCAWVKHGGAPQFTGDRPAVGFEAITVAHRPGKKRWNGGGKPGVYTHSIVLDQRGEERIHTTQKPEGLIDALLRDFSDPGELVLDAFAGSGTTGVAAKRLGRRFVGWELQEKYQRAAQARIDATHEQLELVRVKITKPKQAALL